MKSNLKIVFLLTLSLILSVNVIGQEKKSKKTQKKVFDVSMTCDNCVTTIEKNIAFENGVLDMQVNLKKKTVTIVYDTTKIDSSKLIESFQNLGYEAAEDADFTNCSCKVGTDCASVKKASAKVPCEAKCNNKNATKHSGCC